MVQPGTGYSFDDVLLSWRLTSRCLVVVGGIEGQGDRVRIKSIVAAVVFATVPAITIAQSAAPQFVPIRLRSGTNQIPNIAGDGRSGSITLDWRENGNAWGYDIFTVRVGGSIAAVDGRDRFTDQPHVGEDMIRAVRFAKGRYGGRATTFAFVADRKIVDSVPDPAATVIEIYALVRNDEGVGTPYEFRKVRAFTTRRRYCNADVALTREGGLPPRVGQDGPNTIDGC